MLFWMNQTFEIDFKNREFLPRNSQASMSFRLRNIPQKLAALSNLGAKCQLGQSLILKLLSANERMDWFV